MCVAAAIAGAAVVGAGASMYAGDKAASAQKKAAASAAQTEREGLDQQRQIFDIQRQDLAPYREAGYGALTSLRSGTADGGQFMRDFSKEDFNADPGYQFRQQEGEQAIQRGASARGLNLSGATLKALDRFNSGNASQEYGAAFDRFNTQTGNRFNRLSSLAGIGQNANAQTQAAGGQFSNALGNYTNAASANATNLGNVSAANSINTGNAIAGGLNSAASNYLTYKTANARPAIT